MIKSSVSYSFLFSNILAFSFIFNCERYLNIMPSIDEISTNPSDESPSNVLLQY